MDIEKLKLLDNLKENLKFVKAREMQLRKEIMSEISGDYEGEKKSFDWVDPEGSVTVTCDLKLQVDEEAYTDFLAEIDTTREHDLTPAELLCIEKKETYKINRKLLKDIPEDSVIYEFIDSEPALSTIKYNIDD